MSNTTISILDVHMTIIINIIKSHGGKFSHSIEKYFASFMKLN